MSNTATRLITLIMLLHQRPNWHKNLAAVSLTLLSLRPPASFGHLHGLFKRQTITSRELSFGRSDIGN